jgi:hypothetical protein
MFDEFIDRIYQTELEIKDTKYRRYHIAVKCPGRWLSSSTPVSSTSKPNRHDITEILLKVALNTINQTIK